MKKLLPTLLISLAGLTLATAASAAQTVLTFDDIGSDGFVAANYGGLDWSGSDWFVFGEPNTDGLPYTAHSGDYRAISGFEEPDENTTVRFGANTTFQGAWFAGLGGATVTFDLYYQGALVATSATLDPSATPAFLSSGYTGLVDEVIVSSPGQGSYSMDDFTFTQAVPEPGTYALLLAGLGVVGFTARRRANRG